jgi:hypothetical protein
MSRLRASLEFTLLRQRSSFVYEVPITHDGRGYDEGKKICRRDGMVALWVLLRYRFSE